MTHRDTLKLGVEYLARAFDDPDELEERARETLRGREFDSMVGTGLSGSLVVPILARRFGVPWAIVRKSEESSHSTYRFEGTLGRRWLFVDDLIESGKTLSRVREQIDAAATLYNFTTVYHGAYLYRDNQFRKPPV